MSEHDLIDLMKGIAVLVLGPLSFWCFLNAYKLARGTHPLRPPGDGS